MAGDLGVCVNPEEALKSSLQNGESELVGRGRWLSTYQRQVTADMTPLVCRVDPRIRDGLFL